MNSERVARYVELAGIKKRQEEELDATKAEIAILEARLLEEFGEMGMQSMKTAGGATVFLYSQLWAGAARTENDEPDWARAGAALEAAGLGEFVEPRFNVMTLSAWVREQPRDENDDPILPEGLKEALRVSRKVQVRVRGAGA